MSLSAEERRTLVEKELERACETFEEIEVFLFSQNYIKTGKLPLEFGKLYNNLQTLREKSDYNCFYDVDEQDINEGTELARRFIEEIGKLID